MAIVLRARHAPRARRGSKITLGLRALLALAGCCVCLLQTVRQSAGTAEHSADEVKAAFLYNILLFADWPEESALARAEEITLGVVADNDLWKALQPVAGKKIGDRVLVLKRLRSADDVTSCHLLFIGTAERAHLTRMLAALKESATISVGEMPDFTRRGGMVRLLHVPDSGGTMRLSLEVNLTATEARKVKFRAQLLKVARVVRYPEK
jgi:hypothetical protein